jgi:hypothetical protein
MKLVFAILITILLTSHLQADEQKEAQTIYPAYLHQLSFDLKLIPEFASKAQFEEVVEVNSELYPGLDLELTLPDERLSFQKFELTAPVKGPSYFQPGGNVMYYYGIYSPSGQLVSLPVPSKTNKKD